METAPKFLNLSRQGLPRDPLRKGITQLTTATCSLPHLWNLSYSQGRRGAGGQRPSQG